MQLPIDGTIIITTNLSVDTRIRVSLKNSMAMTFPSPEAADRYLRLYAKEVDYCYIDVDSWCSYQAVKSYLLSLIFRKLDIKVYLVAARLETLKATGVNPIHFELLPPDHQAS